ncbi:MAG: HU family DNA-binding protein [Paludibacter sp.]|nr:HU family DNA-binding protein [Paludibacter sp.]
MTKEKVSSQEIIDLLAERANVSKKAAEEFLRSMFGTVEEALIKGEIVKIKGFGAFKLNWNAPRKSVNVQTGEEIILPGYPKVTFSPESQLKEAVNEPFAHLEAVVLDAENQPVVDANEEPEAFEPLKIFTEQAAEIKDILSEISALSNSDDSGKAEIENSETEKDVVPVDEDQQSANVEQSLMQVDTVVAGLQDDEEDDDDNINAEPEGTESSKEKVVESEEDTFKAESVTDEQNGGEQVTEEVASVNNAIDDVAEEQSSVSAADENISNSQNIPEEEVVENKEDDGCVNAEPEIENKEKSDVITEQPVEDTPDEKGEAEKVTDSSKKEDKESKADSNEVSKKIIPTNKTVLSINLKPFLTNPHKKFRKKMNFWLVLLIVILSIIIGFALTYYLSSATRCWVKYDVFSYEHRMNLKQHWTGFTGLFAADKKTATPVLMKKQEPVKAEKKIVETTKTDTTGVVEKKMTESIPTLQQLLDGPRTYTEFVGTEEVKPGSMLTVISERYYGLRDFWVYIYEANKSIIKDPDKIPSGTIVKIPKLDKRLIDKNNQQCVDKAKELRDLYVGKKQ